MHEHLAADALLKLLDGELPVLKRRQYRRHLHDCWKCRAALEQLEQDLGSIVRAQELLESAQATPPPRPWQQLNLDNRRTELSLPKFFNFRRENFAFWRSRPVQSISLAAALCIVALLAAFFVANLSPVSAKEILEKVRTSTSGANAAPKQGFAVRQKVHLAVTKGGHQIDRPVDFDVWKSGGSVYWASAGDDAAQELQTLYREHGVPLDLPLANRSAVAWTTVTNTAPLLERGPQSFTLSFVDLKGERPARVDLELTPGTWLVKSLSLRFGGTTYRLSEISLAYVPEIELSDRLRQCLSLPIREQAPAFHQRPPVMADTQPVPMAARQLQVDLALHALGADLGEPVTISRNQGILQVDVTAEDENRRQEISARLAGIAGVQMLRNRGREHLAKTAVPVESSLPKLTDPDQQIVDYFGDVDREVAFTARAMELDESLLAQAYLLRRLEREFPPSERQTLSAKELQDLDGLLENATTALRAESLSLKRWMDPLARHFGVAMLVGKHGADSGVGSASAGSGTLSGSERLAQAQRIDRLVRGMLTTNSGPLSPRPALFELAEVLTSLATAQTPRPSQYPQPPRSETQTAENGAR